MSKAKPEAVAIKDDISSLYFNAAMIDELDSDPRMQRIGALGQLAWMWAFYRMPVVEFVEVEDVLHGG